jgi:hypothetical protein
MRGGGWGADKMSALRVELAGNRQVGDLVVVGEEGGLGE